MQDPSTRLYDPPEDRGSYNRKDHECHISGERFVRSRCDRCPICSCSGEYDEIELISCEDSSVCRYCGDPDAHGSAIIIATDGACRNNGRADAVAGCGVFFGINSMHNHAFNLAGARQTSQRAELSAAIYALSKIRNMAANGGLTNEGCLDEIIIKTDSSYVVNGMTNWIRKWRNNGYINAKGLPLVNQDLIQHLDSLCNTLDDLGIQVRFWDVPRGWNRQADKLANAGLDGSYRNHLNKEEWFEGEPMLFVH
jgi:ribonuclease HI